LEPLIEPKDWLHWNEFSDRAQAGDPRVDIDINLAYSKAIVLANRVHFITKHPSYHAYDLFTSNTER